MMTINQKPIFIWLLSTCFLIWIMIMLGGATRLTHAGLSIVEWAPIRGAIPPLSDIEWQRVFQAYQQFPEYQLINKGMLLSDFKFIFLMEFTHRLLGRLIGIWFFIPMVYFWIKGSLPQTMKNPSILIFVLGGMQGVMGWYMVKSGLVKDPTVSHYRLVAHLGLAIVLYALLLSSLLSLIKVKKATNALSKLTMLNYLLIAFTMLYGGFVAGLKAGLIYNTFPMMDGQWIPDDVGFYKPWYLNFFENPATVQLIHRCLALITFISILITSVLSFKQNDLVLQKGYACLTFLTVAQVLLGIITLVNQVPPFYGTLHQGVAILVFSFGSALLHYSRRTVAE